MKRGTPNHPKTLHLAELLSIEPWGAVGVLEMLWHFTATYAPRGDIGRHTDIAIERGITWRREPGRLVQALREARWLDDCCAEHRLRVHDWPDHADQTVKRGALVGGTPGDSKKGRPPIPGLGFLGCYRQPSIQAAASGTLVAEASDDARDASVTLVGEASDQLATEASGTLADASLPLPLSVAVALSRSLSRMPEPEPAATAGEPAPTPATAAEAKVVALERLGPLGAPNPLVGSRRPALELEWLQLVRKISERTGEYPEDVAPKWDGRSMLDPAKIRDDRLLRDLGDLRKRWADLEARDRPPQAQPPTAVAIPTLPDDVTDEATTARETRMRDASRRLREVLNGSSVARAGGGAGEAGPDPAREGSGGGNGAAPAGDDAGGAAAPATPAPIPERAPVQRADGPPAGAGPVDGRHEFVGHGLIRAKGTRVVLCEAVGCLKPQDHADHVPVLAATAGGA